jgi:hypothetical protein
LRSPLNSISLAGTVEQRLTWADLLIDPPSTGMAELLAPWRPVLNGRYRPIAFDAFGNLFFERPDGSVHVLDVIEGALRSIAPSFTAFQALVNTREWQEEQLASELVWQLHQRGIKLKANECYAIAPHPVFGAGITPDRIMPMSIQVWLSLSAQSHGLPAVISSTPGAS